MTTTPRLRRWPGNLDRLSGRTPLRVKMITALLALVIVALAIISVASLTVFRNYQIQRANQQVTDLYQQEVMGLHAGHGVNPGVTAFGPYLIAIVPSGTSLAQQAARQPGLPAGTSLPYVPTSGAWYNAHGGHLINVGSVSGSDNWQVVAQQIPVVSTNFFGQSQNEQRHPDRRRGPRRHQRDHQPAGRDRPDRQRDHRCRPGRRGRGHRPGQPAPAGRHREDRPGHRRR